MVSNIMADETALMVPGEFGQRGLLFDDGGDL